VPPDCLRLGRARAEPGLAHEESLWLDVTEKSPHNGRGLMNYGLTQMSKGEIRTALDYFERALSIRPTTRPWRSIWESPTKLNRTSKPRPTFRRAIELAPGDAQDAFLLRPLAGGKRRAKQTLGNCA